MGLLEDLLALEDRGNQAMVAGTAAAFYDDMLTDDVVLIVPGMTLDRATFLASLSGEPDMRTLRIEAPCVLEIGPDSAALLYRAVADLHDGGTWTSAMNSTYVRRDGEWKLALHQQTPDSA